ncbi:MAG: hypothetical protein QXS05_03275 [Candidatus Bathyarchaeia archaeon]
MGHAKYDLEVAAVSSVDIAKQIHEDIDQTMRGLSVEDQEIVLREAQNIVKSLRRIEQIASKAKTQA